MRYTTCLAMWSVLFCLASSLATPVALAATPMRAVILFDNSGSMRQNDPLRLSRMAVQLFVELARPHDQLALVAFSDTGVPIMPLTSLASPGVRQTILSRLRTLQFDGQTTDLAAALQAGLASLPASQEDGYRDLVLLITDGKLDLGPKRRSAEPLARQGIQEAILPQYRQRGIVVYTIAFTDAADRLLLQDMAQGTGGEWRYVANAPMLHKAFSDLFIAAKEAESIPIHKGTVVMDHSIQEAALILAKPDAQEAIGLITPQQQRLHAHSAHPGVQWQVTPAYDMIQLTTPEPGTWRLERTSEGQDDVAIIGASTLHLEVTLTPDYLEAGEPFRIRARLLEQHQPLRDPQRLQAFTVQADLQIPDNTSQALSFQLDPTTGEFLATGITPEAERPHRLRVMASSSAVQRQRVLTLLPQPRCFIPAVLTEPAVTVQVTLNEVCPAFETLQLAAGYIEEKAPEPITWQPMIATQPRLFQVTLPRPTPENGAGILVRLHGQWGAQRHFTVLKGPLLLPELLPPPPSPSSTPPPFAWRTLAKTVGWQLLLINTLLGVMGGGGYRLYYAPRRHRRTAHG